MRLHRFHVNTPISGNKFDISDRDLIHQWRTVIRYNVGSQVILFDGSGVDCLSLITSLRNLGATVEVVEKKNNKNMAKINLTLCVGIIKKDNFELVVQKATELGVTQIIPVLCERSEKKKVNMERLQKIAVEASEQSGRFNLPEIHEIMELSDLLQKNILPKEKIVLNVESEKLKVESYKDNNTNVQGLTLHILKELAVFIGPEGGWSDREVQGFASHNIPSVSLGSQILRAETASIAVVSLLLL